MALSLQASPSLRELVQVFAREVSARKKGVFEPDYIVTQTEGMNNFLRLQLARQTGISANCRYLTPNEIILQAFRLLAGEMRLNLSVTGLRWQLFKILGEAPFLTRFPKIAGYYQEGETDRDLKRLELATKVADLFDQYQIYRPQLIRRWNRSDGAPAEDWQQYLWQAVVRNGKGRFSDKTHMSDAILAALRDPDSVQYLQRHMPAVYLFGISIITDYHITLLYELSKVIDIHFYLLDPAAGVYWYEDRSEKQLAVLQSKGIDTEGRQKGNALLTSWGRVVQDTFRLLFRHDAFLNAYDMLPALPEAPHTLLGKLQDDIRNNCDRHSRHTLSAADLADGSLTVSACHTPLREVEALYNYLLHLYEQEGPFAPQEVLVMATDINAYAPYIKAVFENAPYRLRYSISDENPQGGDTLTDALVAILQLHAESFKPEEVVQLLYFSALRERFQLHDMALIRRLVTAANIRFGLSGEQADDTRYVSWHYGLQRIVYGACMCGEDLCHNEDGEPFHPLDMVEGAAAETAIRFAYFAAVLMQHLQDRYRARSIAGWVSYIERLINDLLADAGEEIDEELQALLAQLGSYNAAYEYMSEPIAYEVFSRSLLQSLRAASQSATFGYGGITFCSMVPMRSIPFRTVALLGMDHDKFPRREPVITFSKMNGQRETGDRNVRDNDRHLFLETLLSAEKHLYISYIGRMVQDNSLRPPSPLVEELLDYVEEGLPRQEQPLRDFVIQHPLHNSSSQYNGSDPRLRDYLRHPTGDPARWTLTGKEAEAPQITEIPVHSLSSFAKNALAFWYRRQLGISYDPIEATLADTELLGLDSLQSHALKHELLHREEAAYEDLRLRRVRTGGLPLSSMSVVVMEDLCEEIGEVKRLKKSLPESTCTVRVPVELALSDTLTLTGTLEVCDGAWLCYVCLSKNETAHQISAGIQYLLGVATGVAQRLHFVSQHRERVVSTVAVSAAAALELLQQMAALYEKGHRQPLVFTTHMVSGLNKKEPPQHMTGQTFAAFINRLVNADAGGGAPQADQFFEHHYRQGLCNTSEALTGFQEMFEVFYERTRCLFDGW